MVFEQLYSQYAQSFPDLGEAFIGSTAVRTFLVAFALFAVIIGIGLYVYWAFAWMTIAKKFKYDKPWLAWIPVANLFLIPILAKKKWTWGFFILLPPVYFGLYIYWSWIIFKMRGYPGPLALIALGMLPPLSAVGFISALSAIGYFVVLGLVAWKDIPKKKK